MKNVFNWTIGSFFRTLGRIIAYVAIGSIIAFAFSYKPKAATLTPRSTYPNNTNHVIGQDFSYFGSDNTFSYSTSLPNLYGSYFWEVGNTGSAISGQAYAISLGFQTILTAQKYYDVTINFRSTDLRNIVNTSSIVVLGGSNISTLSTSNLSLIGVTNNATSSVNANKLIVRVYSVQANSYFAIQIYDMQNNITSVNNFGISSVSIVEVDTTNSQEIINNQTNNTQNIINNNNNNTQEIINNQNELLGSKCSNIFQFNLIQNGVNYIGLTATKKNNGVYNFKGTATGEWLNLSNVSYFSSNQYFSANSKTTTNNFYVNNNSSQIIIYDSSNNMTFIHLTNGQYYDFDVPFTISEGQYINSYCEYGTYLSKLDDTNNAINGVNDSLNNDNVDGATNKASNFFSNFTTNTHGLTSIITAPLAAIQSLTSVSCSPLVLPLPFVNQNLTLPCMRPIYVDNFGGFMTLYDTITLGIVSYWVLVRIFALVKDFKNPDHDEVEVMDL